MTTIVDTPERFLTNIKRIVERREEFQRKMQESNIICYTVEHFTDCFIDNARMMKAIHIRLYLVHTNQRPTVANYSLSWEDFPQNRQENWNEFRKKVHQKVNRLLTELQSNPKAIPGSL